METDFWNTKKAFETCDHKILITVKRSWQCFVIDTEKYKFVKSSLQCQTLKISPVIFFRDFM